MTVLQKKKTSCGCLGLYVIAGLGSLFIVIGLVIAVGQSLRISPTSYPTNNPTIIPTPDLPTQTPLPADTPLPTDMPTATSIPTITPLPIATQAPPTAIPIPTATLPLTATPLPTPTLEPAAALNANVRNALGEGNRDLPRVASVEYPTALNIINVTWALNLAWDNAALKRDAQMDAAKILKAVHESGIVFDFMNLTGTTELTDTFGQATESPVVWYTIEYETLQRINWQDTDFVDFVLYQRIDEIADSNKYHPAFEE